MTITTFPQLLTNISTRIPDNTNQEVDPADVRQSLIDIVDQIKQNEKVVDIEQYGAVEGADATAAVNSAIASLAGGPGVITTSLSEITLSDIRTTGRNQKFDFSLTDVRQRDPSEKVFWLLHPFCELYTKEILNYNGAGTGSHVVVGDDVTSTEAQAVGGGNAFGCRVYIRSRFAAKYGLEWRHGSHLMGFVSVFGSYDDGIHVSVEDDFDNNHAALVTTSSFCGGWGVSVGRDLGAVNQSKRDNWRGSGGQWFSKCFANVKGAMFMGASDNHIHLFAEQQNDVIFSGTTTSGSNVMSVDTEGGSANSFILDQAHILNGLMSRFTVGSRIFTTGIASSETITAVDEPGRTITLSVAAPSNATLRAACPRVGSEALPALHLGFFARGNTITLVGDNVDPVAVRDDSEYANNHVQVRERIGGQQFQRLNAHEVWIGDRTAVARDADYSNSDTFGGARMQMRPKGGAMEIGPSKSGDLSVFFAPKRNWKQATLAGDNGDQTATIKVRDLSVFDASAAAGGSGWAIRDFGGLIPDDATITALRVEDKEVDIEWPDAAQNVGTGTDTLVYFTPNNGDVTPGKTTVGMDHLRVGGIEPGQKAEVSLVSLPRGTTENGATTDGAQPAMVYRGTRDGILRIAQGVQNSGFTALDLQDAAVAETDADAANLGVPIGFVYVTSAGDVRVNMTATPSGVITPPSAAPGVTFDISSSSTALTFTNGDTSVVSTDANFNTAVSDIITSDAIYFEATNLSNDVIIGVSNSGVDPIGATNNWISGNSWGVRRDGSLYQAGTISNAGVSTFNSDIARFWFKANTGEMWVAFGDKMLGGGDPVAGTSPTFTGITGANFRVAVHTRSTTQPVQIHLASNTFRYAPDNLGGNAILGTVAAIDGSTDYNVTNPLPPLPEDEVYFLWFAGQSNMLGGDDQEIDGVGSDPLTQEELRETFVTRRWIPGGGTNGSWGPFTVADINGVQQPHGPDVFLVQQERELMLHNQPTYMVKTAVGGTAIQEFMPGGSFHTTMVERMRGAVNALVAEGYKVRPVLFWHQGETQDVVSPGNPDGLYADAQEGADAHEANFTAFVSMVRGLFAGSSTGDIPIVVGQLWDRPTYESPSTFQYVQTVNQAFDDVAAVDANVHVVPTKDLSVYDLVHFDSPSQQAFGELCADALRTINKDCLVTAAI